MRSIRRLWPNDNEIAKPIGEHLLVVRAFAASELASRLPGPRSMARRSSSASAIYAVIKTKKNVVAVAVMISSTIRGSRNGFMPP